MDCSGLAYIEPELRENRGELAAASLDFQSAAGEPGSTAATTRAGTVAGCPG